MTSDTKVGLLLGLLFIFVIAFLINGLPSFKDLSADGNELLTNMMSMDNNTLALAEGEQHARQRLFSYASPAEAAPTPAWPDNTGREQANPPRFQMALPQSQGTSPAYQTEPIISHVSQETQQVAQQVLQQQPQLNQPKVRYHVVQEGELLATIAKEVYGREQGNRTAVINRLFEANRKTLKSPDKIYVGQRLVIPPLTDAANGDVILAANFVPVQSMGTPSPTTLSKPQYYTVRDGDSLWKIASSQLGNGNRYTDIAKLNRSVLGDENALTVGMKLRLPR